MNILTLKYEACSLTLSEFLLFGWLAYFTINNLQKMYHSKPNSLTEIQIITGLVNELKKRLQL